MILNNNNFNKVLDRIKEIISIERYDRAKILIDADDKLPNNIIFRNVVTLIIYIIIYDGKFYPQIF